MRAAVIVLLGTSRGLLVPQRPSALRPSGRRATATEPVADQAVERSPLENAVRSLAGVTLSLLAGDEDAAEELFADKAARRQAVTIALDGFDGSETGWLSREEAEDLFARLARGIVTELAEGSRAPEIARIHARRVLEDDVRGTIKRVATKLYLLADADEDGQVSLPELAGLFDVVRSAPDAETFPQPLRALAGSLQLLPPSESAAATSAADRSTAWHIGVPGDDHTLRTVQCDGFSIVGIGRSADASAYFVPELGVCFDAGLSVASLAPRSVFLTHGHRDHTAALPVLAAQKARVFMPRAIDPLVRRFLIAEAQLNYGQAQSDAETEAFLGLDLRPVDDGEAFLLEPDRYQGSPTPLGLEVFTAPHKKGVPSCSYGLFRRKSRLKEEFQGLDKRKLGALVRDDVEITEPYDQGVLFFSGDTTIDLLRERHQEILPKYETVIHEVTFLGEPSEDLDASSRAKGHTHYAQLHPWIAAFPHTTFVLVHWSLRYSKEEVLAFFDKSYGGVPKNVVLWI